MTKSSQSARPTAELIRNRSKATVAKTRPYILNEEVIVKKSVHGDYCQEQWVKVMIGNILVLLQYGDLHCLATYGSHQASPEPFQMTRIFKRLAAQHLQRLSRLLQHEPRQHGERSNYWPWPSLCL
jgi:hypothetical protein